MIAPHEHYFRIPTSPAQVEAACNCCDQIRSFVNVLLYDRQAFMLTNDDERQALLRPYRGPQKEVEA